MRIETGQNRNVRRTAYFLVRRAQAAIAGFMHFGLGDLTRYLDRDSFQEMAGRLAEKYFHRSQDLAIYKQVQELYSLLLVMAPILQRLPLSMGFDWHRGHVLGWFRRNVNGRVKRFHAAVREIPRQYQPEFFCAGLEAIGIHDAVMVKALLTIYRRHCGGTALKDILAHQIFDPIIGNCLKTGYELRFGNRLYRLEKAPFTGAVDLRQEALAMLDYRIVSAPHGSACRHLEIYIDETAIAGFRDAIKAILAMPAAPDFKMQLIESRIRDLVERTRPARSALPQLMELKTWLADKIRSLGGTIPEVNLLPNLLVNHWLIRSDQRLHVKVPTFFLEPSLHDEKTYATFFSPYREV